MSEGENCDKAKALRELWDHLCRLNGEDEDRPLVLTMHKLKVFLYYFKNKYPQLTESEIVSMIHERGFTLDITSVEVTFDETECETTKPKEKKLCLKRPAKGARVQIVCKWWRLDRCSKGNRCRFLHCEQG